MSLLKRVAARLPLRLQSELRRHQFSWQLARGKFTTDEPEYRMLHRLVQPGDWVVDIGANVGHYTRRLSELVGPTGRVFAFEPVPETFSLLAANARRFPHDNVTLINAALSDHSEVVGMTLPKYSNGLVNYYEAQVVPAAGDVLGVFAMPMDGLAMGGRITLVKMDAEGHEPAILKGMRALLVQHGPTLIIEHGERVAADLAELGYAPETLAGSPNTIFRMKTAIPT